MLPAEVLAHDFWIEPTAFDAQVSDEISIVLRVGQNLNGDSVPYITDWFSDYRVIGPGGVKAVDGIMGDDPAGTFVGEEPGIYLIGYRSTVDFVELEPTKFRNYLIDEGLEHIADLRARRNESESPAPEFYSRCAKSLVRIGDGGSSDAYSMELGYTLELIPEANPYAMAAGDTLPVRLLYEREPIDGVLVIAFMSDRPEDKILARTDKAGRVALELKRPGIWLVKAVHMVETAPDVGRADWESFWASLTFMLVDSAALGATN